MRGGGGDLQLCHNELRLLSNDDGFICAGKSTVGGCRKKTTRLIPSQASVTSFCHLSSNQSCRLAEFGESYWVSSQLTS